MTEPTTRQVRIFADLNLQVDGQAIHISGDGHDVTVSAPDASRLLRAVGLTAAALGSGITADRRVLGQLANAANRAGIRVTVVGRNGPVVAVGQDVNVRLMSWFTGSPHVGVRLGREAIAALIALLRR